MLTLKSELEARGIGTVELVPELNGREWPLIGIHSHFLGTTRMGKDAGDSVTDAEGQVHGCPNLFISGPSLFPGYGYANPFYPIVVFALRIAKRITHLARQTPEQATNAKVLVNR